MSNWRSDVNNILDYYGLDSSGNWRNDLSLLSTYILNGGGGGGGDLSDYYTKEEVDNLIEGEPADLPEINIPYYGNSETEIPSTVTLDETSWNNLLAINTSMNSDSFPFTKINIVAGDTSDLATLGSTIYETVIKPKQINVDGETRPVVEFCTSFGESVVHLLLLALDLESASRNTVFYQLEVKPSTYALKEDVDNELTAVQQSVINNAAAISTITNSDLVDITNDLDEIDLVLVDLTDAVEDNEEDIATLQTGLATANTNMDMYKQKVVRDGDVLFLAVDNTDYEWSTSQDSLAITLPAITDLTRTHIIGINFVAGSTTPISLYGDCHTPVQWDFVTGCAYQITCKYINAQWEIELYCPDDAADVQHVYGINEVTGYSDISNVPDLFTAIGNTTGIPTYAIIIGTVSYDDMPLGISQGEIIVRKTPNAWTSSYTADMSSSMEPYRWYWTGTEWQEYASGTGADGESAYQIAVDNGFEGSETDWLESLQGTNGATGATGATGETGATGAAGADGLTTSVTINGDTVTQVDGNIALGTFIQVYDNAGCHNSIYRGKDLGTSVTDEQYAAIAAGTFTDMFIGDFWTINDRVYRIAAFDYHLNTGNDPDDQVSSHHITLVPDALFGDSAMCETASTSDGYVGSYMYTDGIANARTIIEEDFENHLLSHMIKLSNSAYNGVVNGMDWYTSTVDLMSVSMVLGGNIIPIIDDNLTALGATSYILHESGKTQLPLFALNPPSVNILGTYWLRDIYSSTSYLIIGWAGDLNSYPPTSESGIRPAFSIY
ncbi:MAG: hypothetical protein R3Y58_01910 [Eubacteriales bacterium]